MSQDQDGEVCCVSAAVGAACRFELGDRDFAKWKGRAPLSGFRSWRERNAPCQRARTKDARDGIGYGDAKRVR